MKNTENLPEENQNHSDEVNSPYEKKVENILEELEYPSLHNDSRGMKLADFTSDQKSKLLEIIEGENQANPQFKVDQYIRILQYKRIARQVTPFRLRRERSTETSA